MRISWESQVRRTRELGELTWTKRRFWNRRSTQGPSEYARTKRGWNADSRVAWATLENVVVYLRSQSHKTTNWGVCL